MTSDEPPPRFCKLCGADSEAGEALTQPLSTPHIARSIGRVVDDQYRATEEGANFRAQIAQEQLGLDAEAANQLKITDMRSGTRPGEIAAAPVVNPVSRFMDTNPQVGGFQAGAENYAAYSEAARTGPYANAGARARSDVRQFHQKFLSGSGHKGPVTSDAPALETLQPGYVPRVRTI